MKSLRLMNLSESGEDMTILSLYRYFGTNLIEIRSPAERGKLWIAQWLWLDFNDIRTILIVNFPYFSIALIVSWWLIRIRDARLRLITDQFSMKFRWNFKSSPHLMLIPLYLSDRNKFYVYFTAIWLWEIETNYTKFFKRFLEIFRSKFLTLDFSFDFLYVQEYMKIFYEVN